MNDIKSNIERVRDRIEKASLRAGRKPEEVTLVAVTKGVPQKKIKIAYDYGLKIFGENYVQEAIKKMNELPAEITWHFIGRIQRNKVKYITGRCALVHSVDSEGLCEEFQKQGEKKNIITNVLVEVNVAKETTKGGVILENTLCFIQNMLKYNNLQMRGLMAMPPYSENPDDSRQYFRKLRELKNNLITEGIPEKCLVELSMGMSADFEVAIEEGATIVRIGTAIFGPRS